MAMVACRECAKAVSDRAEHCPHCGFKLIATTSWGFGKVLVASILILGLVTCIGRLSEPPTKPSTKTTEETKADIDNTARYACKGFIEKSLHDYRSADLSAWTSATVTQPFGSTAVYEVAMQVRAKNAFNATRLSTMTCGLLRNGDNWTLTGLSQAGK